MSSSSSSPFSQMESSQKKTPVSRSNEGHILRVDFRGVQTLATKAVQETSKPSVIVAQSKARKSFPNSRLRNNIVQLDVKNSNSEIETDLPRSGSIHNPQENTVSACQNVERSTMSKEMSTQNVPSQVSEQKHNSINKTSASDQEIKSKVPLIPQSEPARKSETLKSEQTRNITSAHATSSDKIGASPEKTSLVVKEDILAHMKINYNTELNQSSHSQTVSSGNELENTFEAMPSLPSNTVSSSTYNDDSLKSNDMPSIVVEDSFDDLPTMNMNPEFSSSPNLKNDLSTKSNDFKEKSKIGRTTKIAFDKSFGSPVTKSSPDKGKPPSDIQEIFHPPTPAPTPQTEDTVNIEARMAAIHGEPLEAAAEAEIVSNVAHEISVNSDISDQIRSSTSRSDSDFKLTNDSDKHFDSDFSPSKKVRKAGRPKKPATKIVTIPKLPVEKKTSQQKIDSAGLSREVARLLKDEGAERIMQEMEGRGTSRRRTLTKEIERFPRDTRREKRLHDDEVEEVTKKRKRKRTDSATVPVMDSLSTDRPALKDWQVVKNTKPGEPPLFVPRKPMLNPADASKIYQRRSCSSDSSTPNTSKNETGDPSAKLHSPVHGALKDHGYTQCHSKTKAEGMPSEADYELMEKLSANCHEIELICRGNLLHIILSPRTCKLPNSLNCATMKELIVVLRKLKFETTVDLVAISSSGENFCTGIDLESLVSTNMAERLNAAHATALCLHEFITELAGCEKILVCGVVGSVNGLGVAMLPYFDYVFASEKATFFLPYNRLGQTTEGGLGLSASCANISLTLMERMRIGGSRITADVALNFGLVTELLWPDNFCNTLKSRAIQLAVDARSSFPWKKVVRARLRKKLPDILKEENTSLRQTWISEEFQKRARDVLAEGILLS